METTQERPVDPGAGRLLGVGRGLPRFLGRPVKRLLGLDRLDELYADARSSNPAPLEGAAFLEAALASVEVQVELTPGLEEVPRTGPLVIVANHPYGGIEGVALLRELLRVRPDVKVMANRMLARIVELDELSIWVNPFGGKAAKVANFGSMRTALRFVQDGGALLVFPAGEVSHLQARERSVVDPPWRPGVAWLIQKAKSTVLPMYVEGRNSNLFQLAGLISPLLRTALLPRELLKRRASVLQVRVGRPLGYANWSCYRDTRSLLAYLRLATYALAGSRQPEPPSHTPATRPRAQAALPPPTDPDRLAAEIATLSIDHLMHRTAEFDVFAARAHEIPVVMHELGRLREEAFRAVGEGTGKAIDLDVFDEHYEHLFLWDRERRELVGAYRIGRTDELLATLGEHGLYTRALFRYKRPFLEELGPALELGRAFVVRGRQKSHLPLLMLWQGVGRFVARNPKYTTLFGPVSISADYSPVSRYVMARRLIASTAPLSKTRRAARNPSGNFRLPRRGIAGVDLESLADLARNIEDLGRLIEGIDPAGKGLPVLLRQYLKLNGRVLAFNLDHDFGEALDALLVVDMRDCDHRTQNRILGPDGAAAFRALHGLEPDVESLDFAAAS